MSPVSPATLKQIHGFTDNQLDATRASLARTCQDYHETLRKQQAVLNEMEAIRAELDEEVFKRRTGGKWHTTPEK